MPDCVVAVLLMEGSLAARFGEAYMGLRWAGADTFGGDRTKLQQAWSARPEAELDGREGRRPQ